MYVRRPSTCARPATRCTIRNSLENAADETLCVRWRDRHDISAAHQLAKRHRRLVVELAQIYRPSGLPWNDLTGEGQLGCAQSAVSIRIKASGSPPMRPGGSLSAFSRTSRRTRCARSDEHELATTIADRTMLAAGGRRGRRRCR